VPYKFTDSEALMTEKIEVKGLEILDEKEKIIADKLFQEYYKKIQRKIKNNLKIKIHIKEYNKEGKRKKYSINVDIISSGKIFRAESYAWDFSVAIHDVFKKVLTQIEHKFHISNQHL